MITLTEPREEQSACMGSLDWTGPAEWSLEFESVVGAGQLGH